MAGFWGGRFARGDQVFCDAQPAIWGAGSDQYASFVGAEFHRKSFVIPPHPSALPEGEGVERPPYICPDIAPPGEMRVSNYLLWQISYAELFVSPVLWPDFGVEDLHAAIKSFATRNRRYGALDRTNTLQSK